MTPERWRQIDDLFNGALQVEPDTRVDWLQGACGDDSDLREAVDRLLNHDEQAGRDGFLSPPDLTASWPPRDREETGTLEALPDAVLDSDTGGFTPKAVIAGGNGPRQVDEMRTVVQSRLIELTVIYIVIFSLMIMWRHFIVGNKDSTNSLMNACVVLSMAGIACLLTIRKEVSLATLNALELGMVAMVAGMFTLIQYRVTLDSWSDGNTFRPQLVMKNTVIYTAILIFTYGIYVPKSWRRVAAVVGPLAALPFATWLVLYLLHPEAMGWLTMDLQRRGATPLALFSFDAILLVVLAAGSAYGAHTISRLRKQVVEARRFGQYRLTQRIGSGGMGEVYLAEHQLLKRPCAIKLIHPNEVADPRVFERFEREVRLTATLSHPNTVEIYDYGRTEDGTYYYVMEYLPGLSLAELVERHGPLSCARTVYLLQQVCLALKEAHEAGLIHRDVKPSNIFAARRGGMDDVAKLLDFGLVRPAATISSPNLSAEGQILGTPLYMSPEQAMGGRELDQRSDIYSLGAVAYFLLTGRPPFNQGSGIEVMISHARDLVELPSTIRPGIPDDLERVVVRCLAKKPADRYPDASALERALSECACADVWDQGRAARWWREAGQAPARPIAASCAKG